MKLTHEMYMAKVNPNSRGPNATYIPPSRVGLTLGPLGFAFGPLGFLDTNMLVSATQKSRVGGTAQREPPMQGVSRCS